MFLSSKRKTENDMKYEPRTFPNYFEDYDSLTPKEAKEYFEWYLEQVPKRINILMEYYYKTNPNAEPLDYSPQSLIPLWEWMEDKITMVKLSKREIRKEKKAYPKWFHEYLDDEKFSYYSLNLIFDVGDYFAEVIVRNNPSIHWGFFTKPKDRAGVNCPILLGFKYDKDFDPSVIVSNCAYPSEGIWNNKKLYEVYNHWKQNNI